MSLTPPCHLPLPPPPFSLSSSSFKSLPAKLPETITNFIIRQAASSPSSSYPLMIYISLFCLSFFSIFFLFPLFFFASFVLLSNFLLTFGTIFISSYPFSFPFSFVSSSTLRPIVLSYQVAGRYSLPPPPPPAPTPPGGHPVCQLMPQMPREEEEKIVRLFTTIKRPFARWRADGRSNHGLVRLFSEESEMHDS